MKRHATAILILLTSILMPSVSLSGGLVTRGVTDPLRIDSLAPPSGALTVTGTGSFDDVVGAVGPTEQGFIDASGTDGSPNFPQLVLEGFLGAERVFLGSDSNGDTTLIAKETTGPVGGNLRLLPDQKLIVIADMDLTGRGTFSDGSDSLTTSTTDAPVVVSAAAPPTSGQVLTATSAIAATWQTLTADVSGPASAVDNAIARFDGTTGKVIQDYTSGAPTITDTGFISALANGATKHRIGNMVIGGSGSDAQLIAYVSGGSYRMLSGDSHTITSDENDGASAVVHILDGQQEMTTPGAILLSVRNKTAGEQFSVDKDGVVTFSGNSNTTISGSANDLVLTGSNLIKMLSASQTMSFQSSGANGTYSISALGGNQLELQSDELDGATAEAIILNSLNSMTTTGAKLLVVKNQDVEKFSVDKDGLIATGDIQIFTGNIVATGTFDLSSGASDRVRVSSIGVDLRSGGSDRLTVRDTLSTFNTDVTTTGRLTATDGANSFTTSTTDAPVVVSAAAPPTSGQVLTATSATAANWQTPAAVVVINQLNSLTANDAIFPATNPAGGSSRNEHPILVFDDGTDENVVFSVVMSKDFNPSGLSDDVSVVILWVGATATTGNVVWNVAFERIDEGGLDIDADGFAAVQAVTDTTDGTSGVVSKAVITFTQTQADSIAAGEAIRIRLTRDADNGSDTMVGDAQVLRVTLEQLFAGI